MKLKIISKQSPRRHEKRNRDENQNKQKANDKRTQLHANVSIITLNVKGLNIPIKR